MRPPRRQGQGRDLVRSRWPVGDLLDRLVHTDRDRDASEDVAVDEAVTTCSDTSNTDQRMAAAGLMRGGVRVTRTAVDPEDIPGLNRLAWPTSAARGGCYLMGGRHARRSGTGASWLALRRSHRDSGLGRLGRLPGLRHRRLRPTAQPGRAVAVAVAVVGARGRGRLGGDRSDRHLERYPQNGEIGAHPSAGDKPAPRARHGRGERGRDEGVDDAMAGKIPNMLTFYTDLREPWSAQCRSPMSSV